MKGDEGRVIDGLYRHSIRLRELAANLELGVSGAIRAPEFADHIHLRKLFPR